MEHLIAIFQAPTGDWWIAYQGDLLGYYPAGLFKMLNGGACRSTWYGEVARRASASATGWAKTEMGSGKFAEAGLPDVAYVRSPQYYDLSWFSVEPPDGPPLGAPDGYKPLCYTRSDFTNSTLRLGGPGGKDPGCIWP